MVERRESYHPFHKRRWKIFDILFSLHHTFWIECLFSSHWTRLTADENSASHIFFKHDFLLHPWKGLTRLKRKLLPSLSDHHIFARRNLHFLEGGGGMGFLHTGQWQPLTTIILTDWLEFGSLGRNKIQKKPPRFCGHFDEVVVFFSFSQVSQSVRID